MNILFRTRKWKDYSAILINQNAPETLVELCIEFKEAPIPSASGGG